MTPNIRISPEISMDEWRSKFSESFSLDQYWSIECSSLHKHKPFGPDGLGTTPGLSQGQARFVPGTGPSLSLGQTQVLSLFDTVERSLSRGQAQFVPGDKPGSKA